MEFTPKLYIFHELINLKSKKEGARKINDIYSPTKSSALLASPDIALWFDLLNWTN